MKKVVIIGAGIAGLTAGVYALQSGFDVTIYEAHSIPGGASTSWRRKGYLFEGGMHWLTGSSPKTNLNRLWRNIGALDDSTVIYNRDPFFTMEYRGQKAHLYRDISKLREHLIELSPEDKKEIESLCKDVKKFMQVQMPITDIKGVQVKEKSQISLSAIVKMLPAFPRMSFYSGLTGKEYAMRYKSPLLQRLFQSIVGEDNNATGTLFTIATFAAQDGGYPVGGSLGMARRIADKFTAMGGKIQYNTPVHKVITKNGTAVGILTQEKEIFADAVIVTQDARVAIDTLFDTPIHEPWADRMRKETKPILNTFISLGIEADLAHLPGNIFFVLDKPLVLGGQKSDCISINNYASYPNYAPEGCTAVTSVFLGDTYDFWKQCGQNGTYQAEKQKLAETLIGVLEAQWPEIKGKVAVWDVATPLTYERYLHSYKGSWMTIMDKGRSAGTYPCKPVSIQNLYFAGQRLLIPGGLPGAAETGRKAVQHLCLDSNVVFQGKM